jgi:predicted amidohydrolase
MPDKLKIAALQMATTSSVAENAGKLHDAIDAASREDANVLVAPECALSGYLPDPVLDEEILAPAREELLAHSAEKGLWFALGCPTRRTGRWYNTALLYSPDGELVTTYDKTELIKGDHAVFAPGEHLSVFRMEGWTVALQICFDMRFPENWRILRRKGAELVLHLSSAAGSAAWKVPVLEGAIRTRAAENGMFVVSANDARRPQMLVSAICDPLGKHLASAEENHEMLITATLNRRECRTNYLEARRTDLWNTPEHRPLLLE